MWYTSYVVKLLSNIGIDRTQEMKDIALNNKNMKQE